MTDGPGFTQEDAVNALLARLRREENIAGGVLVRLGHLVITPTAQEALDSDRVFSSLARHQVGDWGDLDADDRQANRDALAEGNRVMSVYAVDPARPAESFYIISEDVPDEGRVTTVLLASDY